VSATIHHGDALEVLKTMPPNSAESVITDPPAGIFFMGKRWDNDKGGKKQWTAWLQQIASEALRVAKPGAYALVWALPRTSNRTADAWEDAGWEILNVVHHLFGQGFPKSKNLKPAVEHWILLRKPLIGSIASNVLIYGTGTLNIDACRAGTDIISTHNAPKGGFAGGEPNRGSDTSSYATHQGRWPANLVLTNAEMLAGFPHTKGCSSPSSATPEGRIFRGRRSQGSIYDDAGSAARYFNQFDNDEAIYIYAQKANKADRNGSRHPTIKGQDLMKWLVRLITPPGGTVLDCFAGSGSTGLAACRQGFSCILIEKEREYIEDCRKRLAPWL